MELDSKKTAFVMACLAALIGCGRSEKQLPAIQTQQDKECNNQICRGDELPGYDPKTEYPFKINGQIFFAPKKYMGNKRILFYWPSKAPGYENSGAAYGQKFEDIAIETFIRARENPPSYESMYELLLRQEKEGRVISKTVLRKGLEAWHAFNEIGNGRRVTWYVATEMKDEKGHPPVVSCDAKNPEFDRCSMRFRWQPNTLVDMRFSARHGPDWPEIYEEALYILSQIRPV